MNEFIQTLLIAAVPACVTGIMSYLASRNNAKNQMKAITEQNKADIEKLIEQHKVDLESLKEKHRMELEVMEKEHKHQMEIISLQHENDLKKDEENAINQVATNMIGGMFNGLFSSDSPFSKELNDAISKAMKNKNE